MAEDFLCPERDELFTRSGLDLLLKRYVIQSRSRVPLETPQEMFLGIALPLAMNEGSDRMGWVKRFYDIDILKSSGMPEYVNRSARSWQRKSSAMAISSWL